LNGERLKAVQCFLCPSGKQCVARGIVNHVGTQAIVSPKLKKIRITSNLRYMHGILNIDKIKN
jgi:hypothetical protein